MTRPTRGREVTSSPPGRPSSFPAALAAALERTADRRRHESADRPAPAAQHVTAVVHAVVAAAVEELGADSPARRMAVVDGPGNGHADGSADDLAGGSDPRSAPGSAVGAPDAVPDTPEPHASHLIEVVGVEAAPLWLLHLRRPDRGSRERLIEHYGSLVRAVAAKLAVRLPASIELADLVQSGTFGLMEAVDRFDPTRAVRFDAYAAQRVRGAMLDELRAQDWVPRTVRARTREVERAREVLHLRTGRTPTDRELAAELGVGMRELRHAVRPIHLVSVETLDRPGGDTGPTAVGDLVVDDTVPDPVLVAVRRETRRELEAAVAQLGERDRLVLRLYYLENRTLAEIGGVLGVTESRVCQLHSRIVTRLRGRLEPLQAC